MYISYGPKGNADLLLLYGFSLDRNPYNSVELTISLSEVRSEAFGNGQNLWVVPECRKCSRKEGENRLRDCINLGEATCAALVCLRCQEELGQGSRERL